MSQNNAATVTLAGGLYLGQNAVTFNVTTSTVNAVTNISGTIALAVTWEAKPGQADAVADVLNRMTSAVRAAEPGT